MAITQSSLTSGSSGDEVSSYASASIAPTANRLVLATIHGVAMTAASAAVPTDVSGASLTFAIVDSRVDTVTGVTLSLWRALSGSPGSGAITFSFPTTQAVALWSIFELDGIDTSGSNGSGAIVQSADNADNTGTVNTITATLSAFGSADNGAVSTHAWLTSGTGGGSATPDTGWTEIHDVSLIDINSYGIETQWRADNDTTALATWSANGGVYAVAAEIKSASTTPPALRLYQPLRPLLRM